MEDVEKAVVELEKGELTVERIEHVIKLINKLEETAQRQPESEHRNKSVADSERGRMESSTKPKGSEE